MLLQKRKLLVGRASALRLFNVYAAAFDVRMHGLRSSTCMTWFLAGNFVLAVGVVLKRMRSVYYRVAVHGRDFGCNIAAGDLVLGRVGGP